MWKRAARACSLAVALAVVAGCAGMRPYEHSFSNDPQGPGLFTGKAGAFVLAVPERSPPDGALEPTTEER